MNPTNGRCALHAYNAILLADIIRRALPHASQGEEPEERSEPEVSESFCRHYGDQAQDDVCRERDFPGAAR